MTVTVTTRRAVVAGLAATPVAGLPAIASEIPTDADPIFAAIERHNAAEARYCAACGLTDEAAAQNEDRVVTAEDRAEFTAAQLDSDDALDAFLATAPATRAGVRAFLRHCIDEESIEHFVDEALETLLRSPVLADGEVRS